MEEEEDSHLQVHSDSVLVKLKQIRMHLLKEEELLQICSTLGLRLPLRPLLQPVPILARHQLRIRMPLLDQVLSTHSERSEVRRAKHQI